MLWVTIYNKYQRIWIFIEIGIWFFFSWRIRVQGLPRSEIALIRIFRKKAISILWYFLPLLSIAGSTIFGDPKIRVRIDSNYLKCCPSLHFVQIEPLYLLKPSFISSKKNYLYGELYFGFLCWFKLRNKQKYWGLDTYLVWTTTLKNKNAI